MEHDIRQEETCALFGGSRLSTGPGQHCGLGAVNVEPRVTCAAVGADGEALGHLAELLSDEGQLLLSPQRRDGGAGPDGRTARRHLRPGGRVGGDVQEAGAGGGQPAGRARRQEGGDAAGRGSRGVRRHRSEQGTLARAGLSLEAAAARLVRTQQGTPQPGGGD